jgi:hypothetical protein
VKDSDWNKFLIPLLAVFAIYLPLSSTPSAPDRQSPEQLQSPALVQTGNLAALTPTLTSGPGQVPGEAARLLCDFFGSKPDADRDAQGQNSGRKRDQPDALRDFDPKNLKGDYCRIKTILNSNRGKRSPASGFEIEYLIATVPDPKDSRLDHLFDQTLDAIQRAIADAGYTFDRYSLPWDRSKAVAPFVLLADQKTPQTPPRHLYEPGVMLFRDDEKLLVLFLVGETPTSGIHKVAFQNALWQIENLDGWKRSGTADETAKTANKTLRIVGPRFSGSADSLSILLRSWTGAYEAPPKVRVVSGSANSIKKDDFLRKIDFQATTVWLEQARDLFYEYLETLDRDVKGSGDDRLVRAKIAWLSEAGTGSGQNVRNVIRNAKRREEKSSSSRLPTLQFIFPLHISQLRVEANRQRRLRDEAASALAPKDPNLALPMGEAGSPGSKDVVPLFSSLETVTMELALNEELDTIHRERIRYVGVTATDPQDRIFLVREIRKHCPNATVFFVLGNDLLYMHSESNADFQGALVISPYPLFGLNQLWTYPFEGVRSREQFSTNSSQGIYNATLALLGRTERMLEYGYPFQTYKEGELRYPALWLGMVGRKGIWPVKAFKFEIARDKTNFTLPAKVPSSGAGASIPGGKAGVRLGLSGNYWSPAGLGVLSLMGGGICLFLLMISRRPTSRVFSEDEFYRYRQDRRINLIFCYGCLLTVAIFISSVTLLPASIMLVLTGGSEVKTKLNQHLAFGAVAVVMLVLTLVALFRLTPCAVEWVIGEWGYSCGHIKALLAQITARDRTAVARGYFLRHIKALLGVLMEALLVLGAGGAMIALVVGLTKVFRADLCDRVFFFLRASDLTNGVSILLPGLLIALAAFLSFLAAVLRLNLAERMSCLRGPRQPVGDTPQFLRFYHERSFKGLKPLEDRVKDLIVRPVHEDPRAWLIVGVSLLVYWVLFLRHFIPSVEGREFDWFFKLGFYIVPLSLFLALLRFFRLWAALEKLLRRLSWHPLISSLAARRSEKERCASLPPVDLMTSTPTFVAALSASAWHARSFCESLKVRPEQAETAERVKRLAKEAEDKLLHALHSDAKGDWREALIRRRESQDALAALSEPSAALLEGSWWKGGEGADAGWRCEGKFFLITHVMTFLHNVFAHLQNLVAVVTIGSLLMLITVNSYPFQPRESVRLFSWVGILTSVAVTIYVFVKISRDKTLSLLAGTTPGRLNFTRDFVTRVMIHGVIPLIALLGAQFPDAVRRIFSWMSVFEGKGH